MSPKEFATQYEAALGTQRWDAVAPLIHDDARVVFSDGSLHAGKAAIKTAYERNFSTIKNESFRIKNIHWLLETADGAAYAFEFHWSGLIQGQPASGAGRGTAVLRREAAGWVLIGEQLGPMA